MAGNAITDEAVFFQARIVAVGKDDGIHLARIDHCGKLAFALYAIDMFPDNDMMLSRISENEETGDVVFGALLHGLNKRDGLVVGSVY